MPERVLVVGTGLIGTSLALALDGASDVLVHDSSPEHLQAALDRGAGRRWDGQTAVDLAVVCVPPATVTPVIAALFRQHVAAIVSHVASVQADVQREVESLLGPSEQERVCGGHPLAGRETRGPAAASSRLFLDRPWVVCPSRSTRDEAVQAVRRLAEACGAVPVEMSADHHDAVVALVSHLPQVASSALAAALLGREPSTSLAGPGVLDTTRLAASDADLWLEILTANAAHVEPLVRAVAADLAGLADALAALQRDPADRAAGERVRDLLDRGRAGRAALPLKRGSTRPLLPVVVSVPDEPGQLAGVLSAAAAAQVNVEDVRVEHLPGRPRGLLELLVDADAVEGARAALAAAGWDVRGG